MQIDKSWHSLGYGLRSKHSPCHKSVSRSASMKQAKPIDLLSRWSKNSSKRRVELSGRISLKKTFNSDKHFADSTSALSLLFRPLITTTQNETPMPLTEKKPLPIQQKSFGFQLSLALSCLRNLQHLGYFGLSLKSQRQM